MKTLAIISFCLAGAVLTQPAMADEAPIVIKFSHVVSESTPKGKGAQLFRQLVEQRLGGRVRVEVYAESTLYDDNEEVAALQRNDVQLIAPSVSNLGTYSPRVEVFDLPFLFDDLEALQRFQSRRAAQELLSSMASHGITGLAYWNNGMKQLSATRELRRPEDAKGLVFRVQDSEILDSQFEAVLAQTAHMPFAQAFEALKSGRVQGAENPWSNIASQKFYTVQPYITESNHGVLAYMLLTNTTFWHSLPFDVRNQLQAIIDEVTLAVNAEAQSINERERERIKASGVTQLSVMKDDDREAWRQAMAPVYQKYEKVIGADLVRAARAVNR